MDASIDRDPTRLRWVGAISVLVALGVLLRALGLDLPMRYDEAHTVLNYLGRGLLYPAITYDAPNNHVLHTLLVALTTAPVDPTPWVVRLPAFLAGSATLVAVAWLAWRLHGPAVALLATALVASAPVLIEYSVNARGYSLLGLLTLLGAGVADRAVEEDRRTDWVTLAGIGVLGFYTIPTMLFPWTGLCLWILLRRRRRARSTVGRLLALNLATAVGTAALYAPILFGTSGSALLDNRYISPLGWGAWLTSLPAGTAAIAAHWAKGVPWPLWTIAVLGLIAALPSLRSARAALPIVLLAGSGLVLLWRRNLGFERVWLWALPFVAITISSGLVCLAQRVAPRHLRRATYSLAALWSMALSVSLYAGRPVAESRETGAFPEGPVVAEFLSRQVPASDQVTIYGMALDPVVYYMERMAGRYPPAVRDGRHLWLVLNHADTAATRIWVQALEEGGLAALESSVFRIGDAEIRVYPPLEGVSADGLMPSSSSAPPATRR